MFVFPDYLGRNINLIHTIIVNTANVMKDVFIYFHTIIIVLL